MDFITIGIVVAVLTVIQSLFGMGLLVFGTPTLILLGVDFTEALLILLPCSMSISVMQVFDARESPPPISRHLFWFCLPAIVAGLLLMVYVKVRLPIELIVGSLMVFSALVRSVERINLMMATLLKSNSATFHMIMGLIHGVANMGGALLSVLARNLHSEKNAIRYTVSVYYSLFGAIQLGTLAILVPERFLSAKLLAVPLALTVYFLIGKILFVMTSERLYQHLLTLFTASYGIVLLVKAYN